MPKINVLDKHVAELIAAGEVVERPASVIKELCENSIDAGADQITVEIKNGGITYMRISDNGCGIAPEDVKTAFLRHATSKVQTAENLAAIGTLGFRGEALASVAAVSRIKMLTRVENSETGSDYSIEGGEEGELLDAGCPIGTTIIIKDIFYNVPARMKFLKRDASEAAAIAAVLDRLALSRPDVKFRFIKDGKQLMSTPGDGALLSAAHAGLGADFSKSLIEIDSGSDDIRVHGYVTAPSAARPNRNMQYFFLNGRSVKSTTFMAAVEEAFRRSIMSGKFPGCVLHVDMPLDSVDINVHPSKLQVRFENERPVFQAVYYAVKNGLEGTSVPAVPAPPFVSHTADIAPPPPPIFTPPPAPVFTAPRVNLDITVDDDFDKPAEPGTGTLNSVPPSMFFAAEPPLPKPPADTPVENAPLPSAPAQQRLFSEADYRVIGEAYKTYILVETAECIYVVDKHAAHERVIYETLSTGETPDSQMLLSPITVTLDKTEYAAILENLESLEAAGFEADDFGMGSVVIRAVPAMLTGKDIASIISEAAGNLIKKGTADLGAMDWLYHSIACRAAVKAGDKSEISELTALIRQVAPFDENGVRYCPHGRPVSFKLPKREFEQKFGRIV